MLILLTRDCHIFCSKPQDGEALDHHSTYESCNPITVLIIVWPLQLYICCIPALLAALSTRWWDAVLYHVEASQWEWSELRGLAPQANHFPGPCWLPLGPTHALIILLTPSTHPPPAVGVIQAEGVGLNFSKGALSRDRHLCFTPKKTFLCCRHNKPENYESLISKAPFTTTTAVARKKVKKKKLICY